MTETRKSIIRLAAVLSFLCLTALFSILYAYRLNIDSIASQASDPVRIEKTYKGDPEGGIPETASVDLVHYYSPGLCCEVSAASLVNYLDNDIGLTEAVVASRSTRFELDRSETCDYIIGPAPEPQTAMFECFKNLGFASNAGLAKRHTTLTDSLIKQMNPDEVWLFNDQEDAFTALKKNIASGKPVIAHVDLSKLPVQQKGPDFVVVTGYGKKSVFMHMSFMREGEDLQVSKYEFLEAWGSKTKETFGPNLFIWIKKGKTGRISTGETLRMMRADARLAIGNLYTYAEMLDRDAFKPTEISYTGYWTRYHTSKYLGEKGFAAAADRYMEAAEIYLTLDADLTKEDYTDKVRAIASKEEQALEGWNASWDPSWDR